MSKIKIVKTEMALLFEKLLLSRLKRISTKRKLIRSHQFDFKNQHSTLEQVQRVTVVIFYKESLYCLSSTETS